jgi:hypothetical protein
MGDPLKCNNAAILGHMMNQLNIKKEIKQNISNFLIVRRETKEEYNASLHVLVCELIQIPYHYSFTSQLQFFKKEVKLSTIIYVRRYYFRIKKWSHYFFGDYDRGKPAPEIFEKPTNILFETKHVLGSFDRLYILEKALDYKFELKLVINKIEYHLFV